MGRRGITTLLASAVACVGIAVPLRAVATHDDRVELADACPHTETDMVTNPPAGLKAGRTIRCVHAGGGDVYPARRGPVTLTRFYPETLQVHRGDIVEFRPAPGWAGTLHTPAFLPADADVKKVPEPLAKPVANLVRSDETPRTIAFHQDIATGSGAGDGCGMKNGSRSSGFPPQPPCVLGPRGIERKVALDLNEAFLHVGRPQPFWVEVDLKPGTYRYHCTYHPSMIGQLEVVGAGRSIPTQKEVAVAAKAAAEADMAEAEALHARLSKPTWRQVDDQRVWRVTAGATTDSGHATITAFLPAGLRVRAGDRIDYVTGRADAPTAAGRTSEAQTVTFPGKTLGGFYLDGCSYDQCEGTPRAIAGAPTGAGSRLHDRPVPHGAALATFLWACEYDEWDTGSPALPTWVPLAGCPPLAAATTADPSTPAVPGQRTGLLEFTFGENTIDAQRAPDDAVRTTDTVHNSGWMVPASYAWPNRPNDPFWRGAPWPTTFSATFPNAGIFPYGCLLHPDVMRGSITVTS